jgi:hypothetical protein
MRQRIQGAGRLPLLRRRFFCTHSFCAASTQQYWFCLSTALSAMVLPYQRLESLQISHSPLLILRFAIGFDPCVDSVFALLNHHRRFTTRHLLCWLRHQRAFRAVSAFCSLVSLSNSVFGATEPVFGASEPVFGTTAPVFGATEPVFGTTEPVFGATEPVFGNSKAAVGLALPLLGR